MIFRAIALFVWLLAVCFSPAGVEASPSLGLPADIIASVRPKGESFPLVSTDYRAELYFDGSEYPGVIRALRDLQSDIERVTAFKPEIRSTKPQGAHIVLVGTLGKSAVLDTLVTAGKLDDHDLRGKWESFVITTIPNPLPGIDSALVIAGSDKRGTIYGIYELSEQLGVSPWYWWADVPPKRREQAFVLAGRYASGEPAVRYRGIFINDERPCLSEWAKEKFGTLNSKFYTKVFELLLRMRANYLWPAMWDNAFNEDDPDNPRLADEYGIVMGTSHHEPMMRAHQEWTKRRDAYGNGQWNYARNAEGLQRFFREGISRNKNYENLVTIGLRGDGDEQMVTTGSLQTDIKLLEQIFADQRLILSEEMHRPAKDIPQLWALFTEVPKFYEQGLRPPEDVTLLWTDDNTGNLRRLPTEEERKRSGGAGIYYHIDMHGGPFSYQWINTSPFPKIAEQMNLAFAYGATRIWIVNVGDLKPLELPIEFFLRMAWNPATLNKDRVADYTRRWAEREFGPEYAVEIADVVAAYTKYNGWRKPELLSPETWSALNYGEAEAVESAWSNLVAKAERLYSTIPTEQRDAFYQLVLHPTKASAIVAQMNIAAGRNHLFAKQGRASTNSEARRVRELFRQDQELTDYYNKTLAGGKWNHLMDQPHLGQFSWEPPRINSMPAVSEVLLRDNSSYGVAVEGDVYAWPGHFGAAELPAFDSFAPRHSYFEVFAEGTQPISFSVEAQQSWIVLTEDKGPRFDKRFWVDIDWTKAPEGFSTGMIIVRGTAGPQEIRVPVRKATREQRQDACGRFATLAGPLAIAASAGKANPAASQVHWEALPDYGRGHSAMSVYPVTAESILPPSPSPTLEYPLYLPHSGPVEITLVLGPVMNFVPGRGLRVGVALDDDEPRILDVFGEQERLGDSLPSNWQRYAADNARLIHCIQTVSTPGTHLLRIRMVDPGIVIQKIILSDRKLPESYFGPPENSPVE